MLVIGCVSNWVKTESVTEVITDQDEPGQYLSKFFGFGSCGQKVLPIKIETFLKEFFKHYAKSFLPKK